MSELPLKKSKTQDEAGDILGRAAVDAINKGLLGGVPAGLDKTEEILDKAGINAEAINDEAERVRATYSDIRKGAKKAIPAGLDKIESVTDKAGINAEAINDEAERVRATYSDIRKGVLSSGLTGLDRLEDTRDALVDLKGNAVRSAVDTSQAAGRGAVVPLVKTKKVVQGIRESSRQKKRRKKTQLKERADYNKKADTLEELLTEQGQEYIKLIAKLEEAIINFDALIDSPEDLKKLVKLYNKGEVTVDEIKNLGLTDEDLTRAGVKILLDKWNQFEETTKKKLQDAPKSWELLKKETEVLLEQSREEKEKFKIKEGSVIKFSSVLVKRGIEEGSRFRIDEVSNTHYQLVSLDDPNKKIKLPHRKVELYLEKETISLEVDKDLVYSVAIDTKLLAVRLSGDNLDQLDLAMEDFIISENPKELNNFFKKFLAEQSVPENVQEQIANSLIEKIDSAIQTRIQQKIQRKKLTSGLIKSGSVTAASILGITAAAAIFTGLGVGAVAATAGAVGVIRGLNTVLARRREKQGLGQITKAKQEATCDLLKTEELFDTQTMASLIADTVRQESYQELQKLSPAFLEEPENLDTADKLLPFYLESATQYLETMNIDKSFIPNMARSIALLRLRQDQTEANNKKSITQYIEDVQNNQESKEGNKIIDAYQAIYGRFLGRQASDAKGFIKTGAWIAAYGAWGGAVTFAMSTASNFSAGGPFSEAVAITRGGLAAAGGWQIGEVINKFRSGSKRETVVREIKERELDDYAKKLQIWERGGNNFDLEKIQVIYDRLTAYKDLVLIKELNIPSEFSAEINDLHFRLEKLQTKIWQETKKKDDAEDILNRVINREETDELSLNQKEVLERFMSLDVKSKTMDTAIKIGCAGALGIAGYIGTYKSQERFLDLEGIEDKDIDIDSEEAEPSRESVIEELQKEVTFIEDPEKVSLSSYDPEMSVVGTDTQHNSFTALVANQLRQHPEKFGYSGDPENDVNLIKWSVLKAKDIAQNTKIKGIEILGSKGSELRFDASAVGKIAVILEGDASNPEVAICQVKDGQLVLIPPQDQPAAITQHLRVFSPGQALAQRLEQFDQPNLAEQAVAMEEIPVEVQEIEEQNFEAITENWARADTLNLENADYSIEPGHYHGHQLIGYGGLLTLAMAASSQELATSESVVALEEALVVSKDSVWDITEQASQESIDGVTMHESYDTEAEKESLKFIEEMFKGRQQAMIEYLSNHEGDLNPAQANNISDDIDNVKLAHNNFLKAVQSGEVEKVLGEYTGQQINLEEDKIITPFSKQERVDYMVSPIDRSDITISKDVSKYTGFLERGRLEDVYSGTSEDALAVSTEEVVAEVSPEKYVDLTKYLESIGDRVLRPEEVRNIYEAHNYTFRQVFEVTGQKLLESIRKGSSNFDETQALIRQRDHLVDQAGLMAETRYYAGAFHGIKPSDLREALNIFEPHNHEYYNKFSPHGLALLSGTDQVDLEGRNHDISQQYAQLRERIALETDGAYSRSSDPAYNIIHDDSGDVSRREAIRDIMDSQKVSRGEARDLHWRDNNGYSPEINHRLLADSLSGKVDIDDYYHELRLLSTDQLADLARASHQELVALINDPQATPEQIYNGISVRSAITAAYNREFSNLHPGVNRGDFDHGSFAANGRHEDLGIYGIGAGDRISYREAEGLIERVQSGLLTPGDPWEKVRMILERADLYPPPPRLRHPETIIHWNQL